MTEYDNEKVGMRLKELRKQRGVTQQEIANALNLTRGAYTNIENGSRETNFKVLSKLADYFNVTTDYLLGKSNVPNPFNNEQTSKEYSIKNFLAEHGVTGDDKTKMMEELLELMIKAEAKTTADIGDDLALGDLQTRLSS